MADITHLFYIHAPADKIFDAISTPEGMNTWWTKRASGKPMQGAKYTLWFGPEHDWRAVVTRCVRNAEFELEMTHTDEDWQGTRLGFALQERDEGTQIRFYHLGWPEANDHYQISCFCWAMYLRLMRKYVETGEVVPYEKRLDI